MIFIQNPKHLEKISSCVSPALNQFLRERLYQLEEAGNLLRTGDQIWLSELSDDLVSDYSFIGPAGLFSDTFDASSFGDVDFASPLEFIGHHSDIGVCEIIRQISDDNCIVLFIPHDVMQLHPKLQNLILFLQQPVIEVIEVGCDDV